MCVSHDFEFIAKLIILKYDVCDVVSYVIYFITILFNRIYLFNTFLCTVQWESFVTVICDIFKIFIKSDFTASLAFYVNVPQNPICKSRKFYDV